MDNQTEFLKPMYSSLQAEVDGFDLLAELALDLRWSWNHAADEVWQQLDPVLWELTHNPWVVLQFISKSQFQVVMSDLSFQKKLEELKQSKKDNLKKPTWFQQMYPSSPLTCVAYFSMEFMLSEALPIYSGGLGNVAGDQLKTASDLGVPVVGVGLLYQQGYFRQEIDKNGEQQALYPYNDPGQLPITPLRQPNGEWLRIEIVLSGFSIWLKAWQVQVGKIKLYLLDSNDVANLPIHRGITSELYGGGQELRLKQELVLGIGGWRLLTLMGIQPEVCHLNEGHAAFAVLERARHFMQENGQPFDVALSATRAGNLFTSHTAVAAGFDRFPPELMHQYLGEYAVNKLGISFDDLLALGRQNRNDPSESFNMAYLAIRGSGSVNAVSQLHEKVSRHLFNNLFSRWPEVEVPVGHVTNGVHMPSWDSKESDMLWTQACGKNRWLNTTENMEQNIREITDENLWLMRANSRKALVDYARKQLTRQLAATGATTDEVEMAKKIFNPDVLTLGFARRFATYKRPDLLLHNPARLLRLLTNSTFPVQIIIAGKAHPADKQGQALIKRWIEFIRQPEVRPHVIFLSDYDVLMAERFIEGVDVWINTPRRPWEASGTSGMKVLVNGGINVSELDGWWAEAYTPEVGWALGDGKEHGDDPAIDNIETEALYSLLENEVIPEFYKRDENSFSSTWVNRMRESMALLTPRFSANRSVREYTDQHYLPAASLYLKRSADKGALSKKIVDWTNLLNQKWADFYFGKLNVETKKKEYVFEVQVHLNDFDPLAIRIELYANGINGKESFRKEMKQERRLDGASSDYIFSVTVSAERPSGDFTVRMIPHYEGVSIPLESTKILWQH